MAGFINAEYADMHFVCRIFEGNAGVESTEYQHWYQHQR
jgi:hypothetical protein